MIDANATGRRLGAYKSAASKCGVSVETWIKNQLEGLAWCYRCRDWKSQAVFAVDRTRANGFQSICKRCMSDASTASRYRISRDDLLKLRARGCAICQSFENIVVDHCHESDRVRDALCQRCNSGIGLFLESPDLMRKAISYLEEHHGRKN